MKLQKEQKYEMKVVEIEQMMGIDYSEYFDADDYLIVRITENIIDVSCKMGNHVDSVDSIELKVSNENNEKLNQFIREQLQ